MSVLIKGIEMPKSCLICVCDIPNGNCDLWRNQTPEEHRRERHPDCPLVEAPKWIPVTERLPEKNQEVLIFLFGEDPYLAWHNGKYWCTEDFRLDEPDDWQPTHWFPLPQPPESDGE